MARFGIVASVVGLMLSGSLILAADPTVSRTADLLWVAFFVTGLIGFGRKNSRRPDRLERWLILAGIFLIYGQVMAGILGDGAAVGQVGAAD